MANNSIKWGGLASKNTIESALKVLSDSDLVRTHFTHLSRGFTDNVFLVEVISANGSSAKYVVKEYLEEWHNREARTYLDLLGQSPELGQPKLLYSNKSCIILEYLDPLVFSEFAASNIALLKDWIIRKHKFFQNSSLPLSDYAEAYKVQYGYLIKRPLLTLANLREQAEVLGLDIGIIDRVLSTVQLIEAYIAELSALPLTLEHGDLEPQNLLIDARGGNLRVLDWVNTRAGCGLFDINQYFETAEELGVELDRESDLEIFAQLYPDYNFLDLLRKARILMLMNKVNFYGGKVLEGVEFSRSKNQRNVDILIRYLGELFKLI